MTLNEVFIHAGNMTETERWTLFTACGPHDVRALPRTTTCRQDGPQYYCRSCWTVFGAGSFRIWNPPVRPQIDRRIIAGS
jgi:predicted RNA-binding Zn-ribbon protein involved in translation (DUF1610 family)